MKIALSISNNRTNKPLYNRNFELGDGMLYERFEFFINDVLHLGVVTLDCITLNGAVALYDTECKSHDSQAKILLNVSCRISDDVPLSVVFVIRDEYIHLYYGIEV